MISPKFGLYFYSWYSKEKWSEHPCLHTPIVGKYKSDNIDLIRWQTDQIARLGVDYIVFELVSNKDWCYDVTISTIKQMIPLLEERGIKYTYLADVWVDHEHDNFSSFISMLNDIHEKSIQGNMFDEITKLPIYFVFNPDCDYLAKIANFTNIKVIAPSWIPEWRDFEALKNIMKEKGEPDFFNKYFGKYWNVSRSPAEVLEEIGVCQFWQPSEQTLVMNGYASVIPGYDDILMNRYPQLAPVVPRDAGSTLVDQFRRAVALRPENILIYGWNEYFEATTIEPTLEYGDFYVNLTRQLIKQSKHGELIHFPEDIGTPGPTEPIYLTPELKCSSDRHPDKIPRWDQDDYVVMIDIPSPPVIDQGHAIFRKVRVTNVGLKPWCIKSKCEPIRLGVRLLDLSGTVVREGRGELSAQDINVGEEHVAVFL